MDNKIIDKFLNLNNVGLIKNASGVGVNCEETCKNTYKIYLVIEGQKITDAKFKAFGNPVFVSVCDEITEIVKKKSVNEAINISEEVIDKILVDYELDKQFNAKFFKLSIENAIKDFNKKEKKKQNSKKNK